jgi:uncharacterized radical SAM protein YgiQ
MSTAGFLPVSRESMRERDWYYYDFLIVTGDAYVDHPSFGTAVIGRVLEAEGYRVAVLAQPAWKDTGAFEAMGAPRYAVLINAGNLDSLVAHYTAAKKRRSEDFYSPGKKAGRRPDRAVTVYSKLARKAFPDVPIIIGGLEASLRRYAHYDYWADRVMPPILVDSGADLLIYGMGESAVREIARRLARKEPVADITDVRGTAFLAESKEACPFKAVMCPSFEEVSADKRRYAEANTIQYEEHDPVRGKAVIQPYAGKYLIVNPPQKPLSTEEFDRISALPYQRAPHPMYDRDGGVPAISEVQFSIIHNRGCFGACHFCALAFHQGRMVTARSHESVLREAEMLTKHPEFKGYIHDVGGPTANFRRPSCQRQLEKGMCRNRSCLAPTPCRRLEADHTDYLRLLRKVAALPGVKKVFIRSGIRFDYLMQDKNGEFFADLVKNHISGQLKVAPEHCIDDVLELMNKPKHEVYVRFEEKFKHLNERYGKRQYLVPYLISGHPGTTLHDAVRLAEYLKKRGVQPEQVQDFYPTPGTLSTCMYYTGLDPRTMKPIYVARTPQEKAMQRALLQWKKPANRPLVLRALKETGREDLIGYGKNCLIRPDAPPRVRETHRKGAKGEGRDAKSGPKGRNKADRLNSGNKKERTRKRRRK